MSLSRQEKLQVCPITPAEQNMSTERSSSKSDNINGWDQIPDSKIVTLETQPRETEKQKDSNFQSVDKLSLQTQPGGTWRRSRRWRRIAVDVVNQVVVFIVYSYCCNKTNVRCSCSLVVDLWVCLVFDMGLIYPALMSFDAFFY